MQGQYVVQIYKKGRGCSLTEIHHAAFREEMTVREKVSR
jgi:hypothetical protein